MSVIAAKVYNDRIEMSADSIIVSGSRSETHYGKHTKIKKINGMVIGTSGLCEEEGLMWMYAQNHSPLGATEKDILEFFVEFVQWKAMKSSCPDLSNEYLIAYKDKLFHVQKYLVLEVDKYASIGAGADFALAALYLDHDAATAVKVACDLCCYVSEPITTYVLEKGENKE